MKTPSRKSHASALLLSQSAKRSKPNGVNEIQPPLERFPQGFPQFLWTNPTKAALDKTSAEWRLMERKSVSPT
jgi:hypothetical protein